ncbi:MAG: hypothetical protein V2J20_08510 [Wenzhouxiangella sp.]|jgi:hypothetical protein|nr:hypothetical protein [Wenzhouxiangella sp.]
MRTVLILMLLLAASPTSAEEIEFEGSLRLVGVSSPDGAAPTITPLADFVVRQGNYQYNLREGQPNYQGIPWNFLLEKRSPRKVQVVFWIAEDDGWFDETDEAIVNEIYDGGALKPIAFDLYAFPDGSTLQVTVSPKQIPQPLSPMEFTMQEAGLAMFCIKHAQIIMNGAFVMGAIADGFGEEIVIDVPDRSLIIMSLLPEEGYEVIGRYEHGVITIPLDDGDELSVTGLRLGPMGDEPGGPFEVYGAFLPSERTMEEARASTVRWLQKQHTGQVLKAHVDAIKASPFGVIGRITVRSRQRRSEYIQRYAGPWGNRLHACSVD